MGKGCMSIPQGNWKIKVLHLVVLQSLQKPKNKKTATLLHVMSFGG